MTDYSNPFKGYIFVLLVKSNFPFTKYFPGTRVNPTVIKCLNG